MYHYEECGLSNVWLRDGYTIEEDDLYGELISIASIESLHDAIGLYLINEKPELTGEEFRFLRKELNLSQKNLAGLIGVNESTLRGWESGSKIGTPADRFLRALYKEHVHGGGQLKSMIENLNHQERMHASANISFTYNHNRSWTHSQCEAR